MTAHLTGVVGFYRRALEQIVEMFDGRAKRSPSKGAVSVQVIQLARSITSLTSTHRCPGAGGSAEDERLSRAREEEEEKKKKFERARRRRTEGASLVARSWRETAKTQDGDDDAPDAARNCEHRRLLDSAELKAAEPAGRAGRRTRLAAFLIRRNSRQPSLRVAQAAKPGSCQGSRGENSSPPS